MSAYKKLLVAVDFSEHSERALQRAKEFAAISNASVDIVHVLQLPTYPVLEDVAVMGLPGVWDEEVTQNLIAMAEEKLKRSADKYGFEQWHVVLGNPEVEIVDLAKEKHCDLILIGSHGLSGWRKLLGSTTDRVLHDAPCDVLSVRMD